MVQMKTARTRARGKPLAIFSFAMGALLLLTVVAVPAPYLQAWQSLSPEEIYVLGVGEKPDVTTLNLIIEGLGEEASVDCLLVLDVSATSKIDEVRRVALDIIELFSPQDRIGLATFSTEAQLLHPLSINRLALKTTITDLEIGGKSALGEALELSRQTLLADGRDDALLVTILLTDGQSNIGRDPHLEVSIAQDVGIRVVPVGIGSLINRSLLEELAERSGGKFFARPVESMFESLENLLDTDLAARQVRVEKSLPPALLYVKANPAPNQVETTPDGGTRLVWEIGDLQIGTQWSTQVTLQATEKGTWPTDEDSIVRYTDFRGLERQTEIQSFGLVAMEPNWPPVAAFTYDPPAPTTTDLIQFSDTSSDPDGDAEIVTWEWNFGDGETSRKQNPEHRYTESGSYTVELVVVDAREALSKVVEQVVCVHNAEPIALFVSDPQEPRIGAETVLDASGSVDPDGRIVSYMWDVNGDGEIDLETPSSQASHVFADAGKVMVVLKVVDDEGDFGICEKSLSVIPSITATRTIETGLPDDETIGGATVNVTVMIEANAELHGLTLHEEIPAGWTITPVEQGRATVRRETGDWLFLETMMDGDSHVIRYTLTVPSSPVSGAAEDGRERLTLNGLVGSSAPRISRQVRGEDKITRIAGLSIPIAISRWNSEESRLDLSLPDEISFDQIQYAVALWLSGDPVPQTSGQRIDLAVMQDLIAYWLTDTSVNDPLP